MKDMRRAILSNRIHSYIVVHMQGRGTRGVLGGRALLESSIYVVNFLKIVKI